MLPRRAIDFPDRGAPLLYSHPVLADIAVGAHGCVEPRAIRTGYDILGPMVIARPRGQLDQARRLRGDARLAGLVRKAYNCVGIGNVEIVADKGDAKGRM